MFYGATRTLHPVSFLTLARNSSRSIIFLKHFLGETRRKRPSTGNSDQQDEKNALRLELFVLGFHFFSHPVSFVNEFNIVIVRHREVLL